MNDETEAVAEIATEEQTEIEAVEVEAALEELVEAPEAEDSAPEKLQDLDSMDEEVEVFELDKLKLVLESVLLTRAEPMTVNQLQKVFPKAIAPDKKQVQEAIEALQADYAERSFTIKELATGYQIQVRSDYASFVRKLFEEKPQRYGRAFLETLVIIAYRQPVTRADIENVRGVAVNPNTIKTFQERGWVTVVGHRDVPGHPELLATTKEFLAYFNLSGLSDLPTLEEIKDMTEEVREVEAQLELELAAPAQMPATEDDDAVLDEADASQTSEPGDGRIASVEVALEETDLDDSDEAFEAALDDALNEESVDADVEEAFEPENNLDDSDEAFEAALDDALNEESIDSDVEEALEPENSIDDSDEDFEEALDEELDAGIQDTLADEPADDGFANSIEDLDALFSDDDVTDNIETGVELVLDEAEENTQVTSEEDDYTA